MTIPTNSVAVCCFHWRRFIPLHVLWLILNSSARNRRQPQGVCWVCSVHERFASVGCQRPRHPVLPCSLLSPTSQNEFCWREAENMEKEPAGLWTNFPQNVQWLFVGFPRLCWMWCSDDSESWLRQHDEWITVFLRKPHFRDETKRKRESAMCTVKQCTQKHSLWMMTY